MARVHRVQQGECLASLAAVNHVDWRTLHEHPNNAALRQKRPNPNILFPGDEVFIPDPEAMSFTSGQRHRIVLRRPLVQLRLRLLDAADQPFARRRYKLNLGDQEEGGETDGDGVLSHPVNATLGTATLTLIPGEANGEDAETEPITWDLLLGHLDPIEEVSGVQARLANLGFYHGPTHGTLDEPTQAALARFQEAYKLPGTGDLDERTSVQLSAVHDGEEA